MHIDDMWFTGDMKPVGRERLLKDLEDHIFEGGKIFVGCDSNVIGDNCTYAHTICLYNEEARRGGRYYVKTCKIKMKFSTPPQVRIMQEAQYAIEIAMELAQVFPSETIEVHLDVNTRKGNLSQTLADQLSGYAKSAGFACKMKPDSWAATGIADGHTR
jgi:predicted RNase H-related nuclease YkuK (DUF458 family)